MEAGFLFPVVPSSCEFGTFGGFLKLFPWVALCACVLVVVASVVVGWLVISLTGQLEIVVFFYMGWRKVGSQI